MNEKLKRRAVYAFSKKCTCVDHAHLPTFGNNYFDYCVTYLCSHERSNSDYITNWPLSGQLAWESNKHVEKAGLKNQRLFLEVSFDFN